MRIENKSFDEERALYNTTDAEIVNCRFEGPADGESALKESHGFSVKDSAFILRYPLWHCSDFSLDNCEMDDTCRAAVWYSTDGVVSNSKLNGIKCLRECHGFDFSDTEIDSAEFGWRSADLTFKNCKLKSEYPFFECKNLELDHFEMKGKYSFQYTENVVIRDSFLDTKDAFWHAKNVRIENCTIKGEYLAWYSDGLTLVNCKIIGTQPLCYCKNLVLENCEMVDCDFSFEYSDVKADISGNVLSVKNPASGRIIADGYGEIILKDSVIECKCEILTR